ncbi:MAG: hypothetical protein V4689_12955 [Verrucomicrobiota bacterium]
MTKPLRQAIFLVIDDDISDARDCLDCIKPALRDERVEVAHEWYAESTLSGCQRLATEHGVDIIFLDLKGVDEEGDSIARIRTIHPYVPIVILSTQAMPESILRYQEKGALTHIQKSTLLVSGIAMERKDEEALQDHARLKETHQIVARRLRKIIDNYDPIKALLTREIETGGFVTKRETNTREAQDRLAYLKILNDSHTGGPFPKLLSSFEEDGMLMHQIPFYDLKTLRTVTLETFDKNRCCAILNESVEKVLRFMIDKLYLDTKTHYRGQGAWSTITERLRSRGLQVIEATRPPDVSDAKWSELASLISDTKVRNREGGAFLHPMEVIRMIGINKKLVSRLVPPWLSRIHGDLHFDNIMVDDFLPRAVRFRLIDPKASTMWGKLGLNDPAYDFGKLLQSSSGHYDLISVGYIRTRMNGNGLPTLVKEELVERNLQNGMSGASVTTRSERYKAWIPGVLGEVSNHLRDVIDGHDSYITADPDWYIRARFYEAAHMYASIPVQLPNAERSLAVLTRSFELFNSFYVDFEI